MTPLLPGIEVGRALDVLFGVFLAGTLWLGVALPLVAAHLEYWGAKRGRPEDREAAARLGEAAIVNLICLAAAAAGAALLALIRHPATLLPPLVWMARVWPWAWLAGAGYAGLVLLYGGGRWAARPPLLGTACAAGAGVLAVLLLPVWGAALAFPDPALWLRVEEDPWALFRLRGTALFTLHHLLGAGAAGGAALMLAGRRAFRWESPVPVSSGARLIRWGAGCVLAASALQLLLGVAWLGARGPAWLKGTFYAGGRPLMAAVALLVAALIILLEVAVSALRRRGSAPRAGLTAVALLLVVAVAAGWVRAGVEEASRVRPPRTEGAAR
ncbi:MAG: hypothetical protein A3J27_11940 [Candidatus Tectomicrobia bacterium RIFCSPLOWO2_12_FULL_69_37]|nr:MAG: hypothetical protein A3J27_11940 [Candidatus Tectomicrobia bacterium RIFCSPLOWO2_12_FULL_69_37]OGL62207.1 MAG: hypothetical protein A3I72_01720 [Candidatus Tectomicrobia bacterium RIFCSPLOWO2_02_FULL_70_19]